MANKISLHYNLIKHGILTMTLDTINRMLILQLLPTEFICY